MDSILPYKYFHRFLQIENKEYLSFLKIATLFKRMIAVERIIQDDTTADTIKVKIGLERDSYQQEIMKVYKENKHMFLSEHE